ncbi:Na/Pi symporter [Chlorogloeopsis sp. ULAP01]|uniref:Na/Pi symporter n=1 Tax=Chlorogloeopsis sp. ULAP01 TaxID=3056483 RepID=UPI0025AA3BC9|nr:Na/Pi symporter [Chlorogloeopsis sp. ULAP01]MDM9381485.1 Na/Pi symporter [Chlorogloeopsis sp. ULAP01]
MQRLMQILPQGRMWNFLYLTIALMLFFTSLDLLGEGFELLGEGAAETLIATTANPITGFLVGILATTIIQSSSTTTSLTVAIVASGTITPAAAIPIMLGANIGTSVTNTIVALGHYNNRDEFKRAFTGSMVLDYFNIIAALIFLPLELFAHILSWPATQLTNMLVGAGAIELFSPLDIIVDPIANFIVSLTQEMGWIVLIVAFGLLYFSLKGLVSSLKVILDQDLQEKVKKYLFGSWWQAMLFGLGITIAVQSSSITTSVIVPIIALGIVVALQALPYFLGANIGTSTTALLAALSLGSDGGAEGTAALMVALVHMIFDIFAIILLFPIQKIREIPVWLANKTGDVVTKSRVAAIIYIAAIFYLLPFGGIWLTRDWDVATFYEPTVPEQVEAAREEGDINGENTGKSAPHNSQTKDSQ